MVGTRLIWCQAKFDQAKIQINNFNKLTVEIFTQVKQTLKISKIYLKLNENSFNQELSGEFTLSSDKPLCIEKEMFFG